MSSRRSRPADDDVLSLVRAAAAIPATAAREKASRDRVLSAIGSRPQWIGLTKTGLLAAAILLIASAAVWRVRSSRQEASLAWTAMPNEIRFVDGTRVGLDSGSDLMVVDAREHHIRATLTKGIVRRMTLPKTNVSWIIQAGSYSVEVGAARFELGISPASHEMSLVVFDGEARIDGVPEQLAWRQSLARNARGDRHRNQYSHVGASRNERSDGQGTRAPARRLGGRATPARRGRSRRREERLEVGPTSSDTEISARSCDALGERGIDACVARCSLDDLRALGDAARYQGEAPLADRALTALHTRSSAAVGRANYRFSSAAQRRAPGILPTRSGGTEPLLGEASNGAVANEALAGRMRTTDVVRGREAGRTIARDYLTRFPEGVHADAARRLLGGS